MIHHKLYFSWFPQLVRLIGRSVEYLGNILGSLELKLCSSFVVFYIKTKIFLNKQSCYNARKGNEKQI